MREKSRFVFSPIPETQKTDRISKKRHKSIMKKLRNSYREMTIEKISPKKATFISPQKMKEVLKTIDDIRRGDYEIEGS